MTTPPFGGQPAQQAPFGGTAAPATDPGPGPVDPWQPVQQQAPFGGGQPAASGSPWAKPSETQSGALFPAQELNGALLLFTPKEYNTGVTTVNGTKDMVVADVAVIGARRNPATEAWEGCPPEQSEVIENSAIFGGFLIGALKGKVNQGMVLGRLYQGAATKGNPPWMLADPTDADNAAAMAYYNASQSGPPF